MYTLCLSVSKLTVVDLLSGHYCTAGSSVITVNNGIDLRPGLVQMSVIYPPSPLCSPVSDYQTASPNQLEISPRSSVLFSTDTDLQEVTG